MTARLAHVGYTFTQFDTVSRVRLLLDQPVKTCPLLAWVPGPPMKRSNFEMVTAAVLVASPTPGERAPNPLPITGSADVFEGVFQVELQDSKGRLLAPGRSWQARVQAPEPVPASRSATRRPPGSPAIFSSSTCGPRTEAQHLVRIPVVLGFSNRREIHDEKYPPRPPADILSQRPRSEYWSDFSNHDAADELHRREYRNCVNCGPWAGSVAGLHPCGVSRQTFSRRDLNRFWPRGYTTATVTVIAPQLIAAGKVTNAGRAALRIAGSDALSSTGNPIGVVVTNVKAGGRRRSRGSLRAN